MYVEGIDDSRISKKILSSTRTRRMCEDMDGWNVFIDFWNPPTSATDGKASAQNPFRSLSTNQFGYFCCIQQKHSLFRDWKRFFSQLHILKFSTTTFCLETVNTTALSQQNIANKTKIEPKRFNYINWK